MGVSHIFCVYFICARCVLCHCYTNELTTISFLSTSLHNTENKREYVLYFLIGLFSDLDQGNVNVSYMCTCIICTSKELISIIVQASPVHLDIQSMCMLPIMMEHLCPYRCSWGGDWACFYQHLFLWCSNLNFEWSPTHY